MPLFSYKIELPGGKLKEGKRNAKDESTARTTLAQQFKIVSWHYIRPATNPQKSKVAKSKSMPEAPNPNQASPTPRTKLDDLLYRQGFKCFFCGRTLTKKDASTEHLQPKSEGGSERDGNLVACCVTLNHAFGSIPLKEKFSFVLKQRGAFKCPE